MNRREDAALELEQLNLPISHDERHRIARAGQAWGGARHTGSLMRMFHVLYDVALVVARLVKAPVHGAVAAQRLRVP